MEIPKKGFYIENLSIRIGKHEILKDINLCIEPGKLLILLGPNGSGKTSLLMAIMGMPNYEITRGRIVLNGEEIQDLPIDERARLGIGMMYQRPPSIKGVKLRQMAEISSKDGMDIECLACQLNLEKHLDRDVNLGFSGGEIKRSEMLQLLAQRPQLALFDEPESGVDLENISLLGDAINQLMEKDNPQTDKMGLIITHTGFILDYVKADRGCVLIDGALRCLGNPRDIITTIRKSGYEECVACHLKSPEMEHQP